MFREVSGNDQNKCSFFTVRFYVNLLLLRLQKMSDIRVQIVQTVRLRNEKADTNENGRSRNE